MLGGAEMNNQLTIYDLMESPTPGDCPHEERVADIGKGKSYCKPWRRWTNCREVGYCVKARCGNMPEIFEEDE